MKKIENNFAVTGFVGKDAEIRQFTTAQPRIGFHQRRSMAQERERRFIRQAHQGSDAHRGRLLQARRVDRPGWHQAQQSGARSHQVL